MKQNVSKVDIINAVGTTEDVVNNLKTTVENANNGKLQVGAVVRLVLLVIAWLNQIAVIFGFYEIPAVPEAVTYLIAIAITVAITVISYWKNNSWTTNAKTADAIFDLLKNTGITSDAVVDAVVGAIEIASKANKNKK